MKSSSNGLTIPVAISINGNKGITIPSLTLRLFMAVRYFYQTEVNKVSQVSIPA